MGMVLAVVGGASFLGYLVWLIISAIRWDSKIPPVIGMLLSAVMIVGGLSAIPPVAEAAEDFFTRVSAAVELILPPKEEKPEDEAPEAPVEEDAASANTLALPGE